MEHKEHSQSGASAASAASGLASKGRLMISKMVFENFKSYAGVKEIGPFHHSFTSVVGPNGSGKSNVFDGLLFVFGKKATKLRLKKVSQLIHNSAAFPNVQSCKVSVHFVEIIDKENDSYEVIPGTEFVVSRSADKSNDSSYYVNGRRTKAEEVTDLLKSKGIDLDHNRFLILQGEVEQIAMMKPKAPNEHEEGFLEYLEDIIGSNVHVPAIEKSHEEVERLNEVRQEKLNRVKIVEKEKDSLEGPMKEAQEYITKEYELSVQQAALFQVHEMEHTEKLQVLEAKKEEVQQQFEEIKKSLAEKDDALTTMESSYNAMIDAHKKITKECEKTKADFASFERKDIKLREDLKHEKGKEKKLDATIAKNSKKLEDLEEQHRSDAVELPKLQAKVAGLEKKKLEEEKTLEAIFEATKGKTEPIRMEMEAKQKDLIPLKKKVNDVQQKVDVAASEIKMYEEKTAQASAKYEATQKDLAQAQAAVSALEKSMKETERTIAHTRKRLPEAMEELKNLTEQEETLTRKRQDLRSKVEEASASASQAKSQDQVITRLMKAKKDDCPGIQGRLGSLGAIDEKYDVAISTAAPALRNIVVDTAATGQKCVEMLRKENLGRATFIMLDKLNIDAAKMNQIATPENAPRLFDLIQVKNAAHAKAFYFAVQDTLVATDMDQALRIAYAGGKRWRVVTLNGEMVEQSGAMSGGGNSVFRGLMGAKMAKDDEAVDPKELKQMESTLKDLEARLAQCKDKRKKVEAEVHQLSEQSKQYELNTSKSRMDLEALRNSFTEMTARAEMLEAQLNLTPEEQAQVTALNKQKVQFEKELTAAMKNTEALEAQVEKLQTAILEAGGTKLRTQKAKVQQIADELDAASTAITKIQVNAESFQKHQKTAQKALSSAQEEKQAVQEQIEQLKAELKQLEDDAVRVMEAFKVAEENLKSKSAELSAMQKQYESMKKAVENIRSQEVDFTSQLEENTKAAKDCKAKVKHFAAELKRLQQKIEECAQLAAGCVDDDEEAKADAENKEAVANDSMDVDADAPAAAPAEDAATAAAKKTFKYAPLTSEQLKTARKDDLSAKIQVLEAALASMKPNMRAIADFKQKEKEYTTWVEQLDQVTQQRDNARKTYEALRKRRLDEFMAGFSIITTQLKVMYQMLTQGGDAELELVDSLDPFSEGIVFSVRPPKKSWKNIQNLSGGEKTLSSLALVFALHHYKPTPLYVMDEIDAALDFKNVSIVANYIKDRTKNAQFIIISLRNNMFELADRLVGIYKTNDCTRSITIDPREFVVPNGQKVAAPSSQTATVSS